MLLGQHKRDNDTAGVKGMGTCIAWVTRVGTGGAGVHRDGQGNCRAAGALAQLHIRPSATAGRLFNIWSGTLCSTLATQHKTNTTKCY